MRAPLLKAEFMFPRGFPEATRSARQNPTSLPKLIDVSLECSLKLEQVSFFWDPRYDRRRRRRFRSIRKLLALKYISSLVAFYYKPNRAPISLLDCKYRLSEWSLSHLLPGTSNSFITNQTIIILSSCFLKRVGNRSWWLQFLRRSLR